MGSDTKSSKVKVETKRTIARQSQGEQEASREREREKLGEALDQQPATSAILRVISQSPTNVQPVFEAIAAAALKLCRASLANVFRFDGNSIHLVAVELASENPQYLAAIHTVFPRPPSRETAAGRAILTGSIVAIPDVLADREYAIGSQTLLVGGFQSVLGLPRCDCVCRKAVQSLRPSEAHPQVVARSVNDCE